MPWRDRILGAFPYNLVIVLDVGFTSPIVPSGFTREQEQGGALKPAERIALHRVENLEVCVGHLL